MIEPKDFYDCLQSKQIDFFTGVPDSLLKNICAYIANNAPENNHIIAANEGGAVALAAGYHIASNKIPLVYMQNSGLGNAINPLVSLMDKEVYSIPAILLIGWRGEPGIKDEPQHKKQGEICLKMLETLDIPYYIIDGNSDFKNIINSAVDKCKENSAPIAIVVKNNTFKTYKKQSCENQTKTLPSREEALEVVLKNIPENSVVVSTTGMLSRELYELREKHKSPHDTDFLTVGSMGHAAKIAMGIAINQTDKKVYCLDGDGSFLMHTGNYAIIAGAAVKNLNIILFNNAAHDSVGGQPTVADKINFQETVNSFGIKFLAKTDNLTELKAAVKKSVSIRDTCFVEVQVKKGNRSNLGRPKISPKENLNILKNYLKK